MTALAEVYQSIDDVALQLKKEFESGVVKSIFCYAFNATGKTRLAESFRDAEDEPWNPFDVIGPVHTMVYNAHFEDIFHWNNEDRELHFDAGVSWLLRLIGDEGLDGKIVDVFKKHSTTKVEPVFDFEEAIVSFRVAAGNDGDDAENIKASRAEESLLVWSIFYAILELTNDLLDEEQDDRAEHYFDELRYVVVDDPVSSMDDTRIVSIAVDLAEMVKKLAGKGIKVIVFTHHALFYNVLANCVPSKRNKYKLYQLAATADGLTLANIPDKDSPFSHHLYAKMVIQEALDNGAIERYHFNLFRVLLEKTASFLGYSKWSDCLSADTGGFERLLHLYSHGKLSELESRQVSQAEKNLFASTFNQFMQDYKWGS